MDAELCGCALLADSAYTDELARTESRYSTEGYDAKKRRHVNRHTNIPMRQPRARLEEDGTIINAGELNIPPPEKEIVRTDCDQHRRRSRNCK